MAALGPQLGGLAGRAGAVGIDHRRDRRGRTPGDPQPARVSTNLGEERPDGRGRRIGIARHPAGGRVEDRRAVADRTGQGVLHGQPAHRVAGWCPGVPAAGRLEAEQPAARGRDPDRAGAVVAVGGRDHPARDRCRRPAGRPAGGPSEIPRVPCRAEQGRLGRRVVPELGAARRAEHDQAGRPVAPRQLRVGNRDVVLERARALCLRHPGQRRTQILEQERDTGQRAWRKRLAGDCPGALEVRAGQGVEGRVEGLDPGDRGVDQFKSGHLAAPDQRGLPHGVDPGEVHHDRLRPVRGRRLRGPVDPRSGSTGPGRRRAHPHQGRRCRGRGRPDRPACRPRSSPSRRRGG